MENKIIKQTPPTTPNPNAAELIIQQAVDKGLPVETIERLLAMRRELKAEFAKEAYDTALAKFQAECPVIEKKKEGGKTKAGVVAYKYAPLDSIVAQVKEILGKHDLSYAFKTEITTDRVKVTFIVRHALGHSEESPMDLPLGTRTDIMSAPQVVASTVTFAKRYSFCNTLGIMTGDEDNDASALIEPQYKQKPSVAPPAKPTTPPVAPPKVNEQPVSAQQVANLEVMLETYGMPIMEFLKAYKVKNLNQLTETKAKAALATLSKRIENGEMWEQPGMPTISTDEPAKVELPPLVQAEVVETPKPAKWDAWKKEGPRN